MNSIYFKNILGWRSSRKLVCFESDDWGSIRIPNASVRDYLIGRGFQLDSNYFTKFDTLESSEDLTALFEVLQSVKDYYGNHPIFTTLHMLGNPDFDAIRHSDFSEYIFQSLCNTYLDYGYNPIQMKGLWFSGLNSKVVFPAYHGREHVNVSRWLKGLKKPDFNATREFFSYRISGVHPWIAREIRGDYQAAFDPDEIIDIPIIDNVILDGLNHFEKYFKFRSTYFVPPNGCLPLDSQAVLTQGGIKFLSTLKWGFHKNCQLIRKRRLRYLGLKSKSGVRYITRNVFFEPSNHIYKDWISKALKEISVAFQFGKPAIICTHRVNYVSGIDAGNRDANLFLLGNLIKKILEKWPDVEFISTPDLGNIISKKD